MRIRPLLGEPPYNPRVTTSLSALSGCDLTTHQPLWNVLQPLRDFSFPPAHAQSLRVPCPPRPKTQVLLLPGGCWRATDNGLTTHADLHGCLVVPWGSAADISIGSLGEGTRSVCWMFRSHIPE